MINFCIAVSYLLWMCLVKKDSRKGFIVSSFFLMVPVVGVLFIVCTNILDSILYWKRAKDIDTSDFSFSKERSRMIISDDIDKASDKVPLEEAFILSDSFNRRNTFLEILKDDDSEDYLSGIQNAMKCDDSEVVHYAATYITDTIAKYKEDELKLRKLCEKNEDPELYLSYLHYCVKILSKKILSEPDEKRYLGYYENYLERLFIENQESVDPILIAQIITLYKAFGENELQGKWVNRMEVYMDHDIIAAKEMLKYYYKTHDSQKFYKTIERIKESPLELDAELLDWVRMF